MARPSGLLTSRLRRSARKWEVMIFRDDTQTLHQNISSSSSSSSNRVSCRCSSSRGSSQPWHGARYHRSLSYCSTVTPICLTSPCSLYCSTVITTIIDIKSTKIGWVSMEIITCSVSHPWGRDSTPVVKFDVFDKCFYGHDNPQSVVLLCVYCVHWNEICPSLAI